VAVTTVPYVRMLASVADRYRAIRVLQEAFDEVG
jgi:hypothetical protein